jgi:glycosyltransferase involved in cell wall biosynthesis
MPVDVAERADVIYESRRPGDARAAVAVSLYNYRDFIVQALESARAQTEENLDLIVVDDGSKDDSLLVAKRWFQERAGSRFRHALLLKHKRNRGLPHARNTALSAIEAPYVFILDADNELYPVCITRLADALDRSDAAFAFSYREMFGDETGVANLWPWDRARLKQGNTIDAMVLMRRAVWLAAGGYATDMPVTGWEDFEMWHQVDRQRSWGLMVPEILCRYRVHGTSMLRTVTDVHITRALVLWEYLHQRHAASPDEFWPGYEQVKQWAPRPAA